MIFNSKVFFTIHTFDRYNTCDDWSYYARIRLEEKNAPFCKEQIIESKGLENQMEEIKIFCNKIPYRYAEDKKTYSFECYRKICIYEEGGMQAHNFYDPQKFKFIMSTTNKLIYPQDFKKFYYPYSEIYDTNAPVFVLSSQWRCDNELYFSLRPLGKEEIVVDTNMCQIYPKNADFGMIPKGLTNLLLKGDNCILR